jgi:hypothetical protein
VALVLGVTLFINGYLRKPFNQEELAGEFANLRYAVP